MRTIKETKKKTTKKQVEEESINLKGVIKVFIIILVIFVLFYGLTILVLDRKDKKEKNSNHDYPSIKVNSNDIIISDILKQKEDKYYVIAIKGNDDIYKLYTQNMQDGLYNIDLNNALNKAIIGNETIVGENPKDIRISDTTLFIIENHVITEYYVGSEDVVNKLKAIAF